MAKQYTNEPKYILIHCTDVSYESVPDQLNSVNRYHRDVRGFNISELGYAVGYHYLYTGGREVQTRNDLEYGNHCNTVVDGKSMNFQSIGLAIGFDGDIEYPPSVEYNLLKKRIHFLQDRYSIPNERVLFHRDFSPAKTCAGSLLGKEWLNNLLAREVPDKPPEQVEKKKEIEKAYSLLNTIVLVMGELLKLLESIINNRKLGYSNMDQLKWYQSTQGPQLSLTLKSVAALLIPVVKQLFGIELPNEIVDNLLDAGLIIFFGAWALVGHLRAKKTLGARIANLGQQVENLGGTPR